MNLKTFFIAIGLFLICASANSQSREERQYIKAINALETTDFVQQLRKSKTRIESAVLDFKLQEEYFEKEDIVRVKDCYSATIRGFDKILENMKNKLLEKKRRESIINDPDDYTELMQFRLDRIMEAHRTNCIPIIEEVTGVEAVGFGLGDLSFIFKLIGDVVNTLKGNSKSFDKMGDEYLEDNFIKGLRVSSWEEL